MSTPEGHKNLWKNIDWKSQDEKRAFYNKYFRNGKFVTEQVDSGIKSFKDKLLGFIDQKEIMDGKNKRPIKISDIVKEIEGE